jgi:hypothetical protein
MVAGTARAELGVAVERDPLVNCGNEFRLAGVDVPAVVLVLCDAKSRM